MRGYERIDRGGSPGQLWKHLTKPHQWFIRVYLGRDASGKRHMPGEVFHGRKRQAEARITELLQLKNQGRLTIRSAATLADVIREWLKHKEKEIEPRTLDGYQKSLEYYVLPTLGRARIGSITNRDIDQLYTAMSNGTLPTPAEDGSGWQGKPLSARTVQLTHTALSQVLSQAVRWQMIPFNPAAEARLPANEPKPKRALTLTERGRFIAASESAFYRVFYRVLMDTGIRPGEASGLMWPDVDLAAGRLTISKAVTKDKDGKLTISGPKNKFSRRTIPLFGLQEILLEHYKWQAEHGLDESGHVFTTQNGTPVAPWTHNKRELARILKAAGIKGTFTLYNFRHTFATLHLESGTPLKVVSDWLGHNDIQMTANTYQHLSSDVSEDWAQRHVAFLESSAAVDRGEMMN